MHPHATLRRITRKNPTPISVSHNRFFGTGPRNWKFLTAGERSNRCQHFRNEPPDWYFRQKGNEDRIFVQVARDLGPKKRVIGGSSNTDVHPPSNGHGGRCWESRKDAEFPTTNLAACLWMPEEVYGKRMDATPVTLHGQDLFQTGSGLTWLG
jgi:hypothetical protein